MRYIFIAASLAVLAVASSWTLRQGDGASASAASAGGRADIVTVDDDASLKQALSRNDVSHIRLLPGQYGMLSVLRKEPAGQLVIDGQGDRNTVVLDGLVVAGSRNVTIRNLTVQRPSADNESPYIVWLRNASNVQLDGISVRSRLKPGTRIREYGMMIRGSKNIAVRNSEFTQLRYGIGFLNSENITIENNEIYNIQTDGIRGGGVQGLTVRNNVIGQFRPLEKEHPDGIQLWSINQKEPSRNITISDNLIVRDDGKIMQGIFIRDNKNVMPFEDVRISGNLIIGGMYNGISVSGATRLTLQNNEVIAFKDQKSWISIILAPDAVVDGNRAMLFLRDKKLATMKGNRKTSMQKGVGRARIDEWLSASGMTAGEGTYLRTYIDRLE